MQYQTQPQCAQLYTTHFGYSMQTNWYSLHAHVSTVCYSKHGHRLVNIAARSSRNFLHKEHTGEALGVCVSVQF